MRTPTRRVALLLTGLVPLILGAQAPASVPAPVTASLGRIAGHVVDAATGAPVGGAHVTIADLALQTRTDVAGRYTLADVPAGRHTVTVRLIGYAVKSVSDVLVPAGGTVALDVTMAAAAIDVAAIEVTAELERGSVSRALEEQRTASQIVSAVSAEQIARSPDGDAGQAIQRVSGVTVQDGRYVFVRGLGERYTTTALNGTRIPSPEPERKVVPLDLFPSGLLEAITTSKTFTPDQPGDASGAQVNLRTRDFLLGRVVKVSASLGANEAAVGQLIPRAPTVGPEWLGFAGSARALPAPARSAGNLAGLDQSELNAIIGSFRHVWSSRTAEGTPNGSLSLSLGGDEPLLGLPLTYLGSATYSYGQEIRLGERRAIAVPGTTPGTYDVQNVYHGATGRASVLWGGLLNLGTRVGETSRLFLNNTLTHSGDNEATRLAGFNEGFNETLDLTRLTFTERRVRSATCFRAPPVTGS